MADKALLRKLALLAIMMTREMKPCHGFERNVALGSEIADSRTSLCHYHFPLTLSLPIVHL